MIFTELLTVAKKITTFLENATTVFDSTTSHKLTCPTDKRWFLLGGMTSRDISSTLDVVIRNTDDEIVSWLEDTAAGTGTTSFPSSVAATKHMIVTHPPVLDAGEYIEWMFGTAQDTAAIITCHVLEVDV